MMVLKSNNNHDYFIGGPTCEAVVNPCGEYVDLSQHGGEKIITSRGNHVYCVD